MDIPKPVRRFEVVRDDGDQFVGFGYSYAYYELDGDGNWSCYSPATGRRWPAENSYPSEMADMAAVVACSRGEHVPSDQFHLLYVKEVPTPDLLGLLRSTGNRGMEGFWTLTLLNGNRVSGVRLRFVGGDHEWVGLYVDGEGEFRARVELIMHVERND